MKLVVFPPVEAERLEQICAAAGAMSVANAGDEAEAIREIVDADALFGKLTPRMLQAARRLRWVQAPTASLEHYMFPELVEHACTLTNMRGLFSDVIADHVFGYILCFARNLHRYIRQQAIGRWEPVGGEQSRVGLATGAGTVTAIDQAHWQIAGRTLGVVGFGGIGAEVGRRAVAFSMRVLAVDPVEKEVPAGVQAVWRPDRLPQLLVESDVVVIAAPHTPETERMFRWEQFRQMKKTALLVNVGRGILVDLDDLVHALEAGEIAGAGLDVFPTEPLPPDHPLWRMENVIITPHVACASVRIAERHLGLLLENIRRFTRGQPLCNVVNKQSWF